MSLCEEMFDVVDVEDRVIGRAPRSEVHARGLRHRAVHVLLFNEAGELFVQKRATTKDTFPGRFDSSASGHLESGETYDACAARELREELGLTISISDLNRWFKLDACAETGWEFVWVYGLRGRHQPVINTSEIEAGRFSPVAEIQSLVDRNPERWAPSFLRLFREGRARGLF